MRPSSNGLTRCQLIPSSLVIFGPRQRPMSRNRLCTDIYTVCPGMTRDLNTALLERCLAAIEPLDDAKCFTTGCLLSFSTLRLLLLFLLKIWTDNDAWIFLCSSNWCWIHFRCTFCLTHQWIVWFVFLYGIKNNQNSTSTLCFSCLKK